MKTVVIASQNPVKRQAVQDGFARMFPSEQFQYLTVSVHSGVSQQPLSDEETLRGALQRAKAANQLFAEADYWIGIEGGVEPAPWSSSDPELLAFAWIVVLSPDRIGKARSGAFCLPTMVTRHIREGKELGEADDLVFERTNSKQENGAVGLLTGNLIDRKQLYEQAVILSLIPFKNYSLYQEN